MNKDEGKAGDSMVAGRLRPPRRMQAHALPFYITLDARLCVICVACLQGG
jgi:hypothetical protein